METYDFPPYGVSSRMYPTTVVLERITHFQPIDYNGNSGTAIFLDTGVEVYTSMSSWDVRKLLNDAD
ncbi:MULTISPECIES: hypothetical protein [Xenorhabdus]|uniref:hypothetical protein n=1 Tax=Xenorhabdus TaxID=626 RepID=UPI00064A574D|nr:MULTISPECIES: hypothetical protein [Xenorhabdus]KLU14805.1 hypothetical protein AAY47_14370 [Xenorhabdus griffiniae]KOP31920.1 hypothetical protein AFK69_18275 [Xenorhabdus sp. GDc328]